MKNIITRKKIMKKTIEKNFTENSSFIYLLITTGKLDPIIEQLDEEDIVLNTTSLIPKGYLTSEEQFLMVIEHIIHRIHIDFWFLKRSGNTITTFILTDKHSTPLLLSKKYIGNSEFISYYDLEVKKACIISFYHTLMYIDKTDLINTFLEENQISLEDFDLDNIDHINRLYQCFRLICLCNCNTYELMYLFGETITENNRSMYSFQIEELIKMTYQRKEIQFLLNI